MALWTKVKEILLRRPLNWSKELCPGIQRYEESLKARLLKFNSNMSFLLQLWNVEFPQCLCRFSPVSPHSPKTCTLAWLESVNQPLSCGCMCVHVSTRVCVCVLWWTGGLSRVYSCLSSLCLSKNIKQQQIRGFSSFPPLMVETSWWSRQETLSMLADTHSFGLVCPWIGAKSLLMHFG